MDQYINIKVMPDQEANENFLINNLCSKLHAALGQHTDGRVGVSFPAYTKSGKDLGDTVRLHGTKEDLERLMAQNWLKGLRDYCQCSEVMPVPGEARQCYFARRQLKSEHNKLQRSLRKGWITPEEATAALEKGKVKRLKLPFIQLISRSNQQHMRVFVEQGPIVDTPTLGEFNAYGLSRLSDKVTVPWF